MLLLNGNAAVCCNLTALSPSTPEAKLTPK